MFILAATAIGVDTLMFSAIVPALPVYAHDLGLSDTQVALIFAAFPVAQLVTSLFAASWVDRAGRRRAVILGAVLLAVAGIAFAFASDPATLTLARAVLGAAAALTWTGALATVSDVFPKDELGFRLGLAETAGGGAGLMGPLVSGALIEVVGVRSTFLIISAFPALLAVAAIGLPETLTAPIHSRGLVRALLALARTPGARAGALALMLLAVVESMLEPLLPLDLTDRLGLGPAGVGAVLALGLGALFLGAPLGGRWSDRSGRRAPIVAGGILTCAALPFVSIGPAWSVTLVLIVVLLGAAVLAAPAGPLFAESVDAIGLVGSYGLSAGAMGVVYAAGFALGPLIGGGLAVAIPFWGICMVVAGIVAIGTFSIARMLPRTRAG